MKYIKIFLLPFLGLLISLGAIVFYHQSMDKPEEKMIKAGVLSIDDWDFTKNGPITLEGKWDIYWDQLLTPDLMEEAKGKEQIDVPFLWKEVNKAEGYATYHLSIKDLPIGEIYSLKMMDYFSAFNLWVDDKLVASTGKVGTSKDQEVPIFDPQVASFAVTESTTDILIQVSNFHYREGGIWYPLVLGTNSQIHDMTAKQIGLEYILFVVLLIIGFIHIGQYLNRKSDRVPLWFGLYCLTISFRSTAVGERILGDWFPSIPMELMMKSSFFWYFLSLPLFLRFISSLYKEEAFPKINRYFTIFGLLFSAIVLFFPAKIYSSVLIIFNGVMPVIILCVLIMIVKAVYHKRHGAKIVLLCMTIYSFTITYDILVAQKIIIGRELTAFGLLIFVLSQSYVTFSKFSSAFKEVDKVQKELMVLNGTLDTKIKERTKELETSKQQLVEMNEQLVHLSYIDGLTGVANRRSFNQKLEEYWQDALRTQEPFSVMLLDVDFFKQYNDNYGHQQGDKVLMDMASIMLELALEEKDLVARYGGEEFAILLVNKDSTQAVKVAKELKSTLAAKQIEHNFSKVCPYLTASIGIATVIPKEELSPSLLILKADEGLYESKEKGRNTYTAIDVDKVYSH